MQDYGQLPRMRTTHARSVDKRIILVSGIPASGKSSFCRWLEAVKGFFHLDVENSQTDFQKLSLAQSFSRCVTIGTTETFLRDLEAVGKPAVVDWGFPPECLPIVRKLKASGVEVWWFDADAKAAREAFIKRGGISLVAFDRQTTKIQHILTDILSVFNPNVICALGRDGKYLSPEDIYSRVFSKQ